MVDVANKRINCEKWIDTSVQISTLPTMESGSFSNFIVKYFLGDKFLHSCMEVLYKMYKFYISVGCVCVDEFNHPIIL